MTARPSTRIPWLVALVAIAATAAFFAGRRTAPESTPPPATAAPHRPGDRVTLTAQARIDAGIAIETVGGVDRSDSLEATAVLAMDETRTSRIGSIVEGTVVSTRVEVGDRVRSGTLLAELHSHLVHDAWADYRRAIADRTRLLTEVAYAREAEARAGRLLESKAISEQERERAEANLVGAEQHLEMARTEVRRSEEALEHLGITNGEDPSGESGERIPVRSPIVGVVLQRHVSQGTAVTPGMPLFVVSDLGALWALAEVDEARLGLLAVGRAVAIRVSAFADESFPGTIEFIADTITTTTRRVVVRCGVPNPHGRLKPGMFATVSLTTGEPRRVLVVPTTAVQEIDGHQVVFVEDPPGTFVARPVTVGRQSGASIEVLRGLSDGDRIVTTGSFLLKSELLGAATPDEG